VQNLVLNHPENAVAQNKAVNKWNQRVCLFQTIPKYQYNLAICFTHTHYYYPYQFQTNQITILHKTITTQYFLIAKHS
jgi:hypothetical protein